MLLGDAPITPVRLTSKLIEEFPFYAPEADQTMFLVRALESLGRSLNYRIVERQASHIANAPLDVSWWQPGTGIALAVQGCWGIAGEVADVFTNLLSVKAPMKVLIFRTRPVGAERQDVLMRSDIGAILKAVGTAMLDFTQHCEGELYLLVERVDEGCMFRNYEFRVPDDGRLARCFEEAGQIFHFCESAVMVG